ncbi:hypothetical protein NIES2100_75180 [Calothrix sp. NIES-2100]|uniref:LysM peptidoglycan-binding domain-containing protein n=1 Tax=Calothrix sp. NIES-2100 TaxID=1954172 RepID=UPI000B5E4FA9|nr:hypothetical protein NIES2100_75180 [Calothrix sp. NIES-2100]
MNIILNCPVCGYQEVASYICPNCDTDLSIIRMLQELPYVKTKVQTVKFKRFPVAIVAISLLILIVSICLVVGSILLFPPPHLETFTVSSEHHVATSSPLPKLSINHQSPQATTYTVQSGDYLSAIAKKLCGPGTSWEIMVKANPQLLGRENHIYVGEVFNIPNCKEQV